MFRSLSLRSLAAGLCLIAATACGGSSGGSSGGSNPAGPSAPALDLAGSWSGKLLFMNSDGTLDSNDPAIVAWTATQSGSSLTGPIALTVTDDDENQSETYRGTLSGTLAGSELSLAFSMPAGTFADAPGCAVTGSGTTTPTSTAITSNLTISFSAACMGTVSDRQTETDQLQLTRQ